MDALTVIHTRRSIRKFTDEPVSEEHLHTLLDAAMIAPSASNQQPWHFVVVDDKALLERIPDINPYAAMAPKAPLAIVVCGDLSQEKYPGYWVQDCSAATQNILLAATALGLGSVWTGVFPKEDRTAGFKALFGLPAHIMPLGIVLIGHPATQPESKSRFKADRVHKNTW